MTISRWWWVRKQRKRMNRLMSGINMNLNVFNFREQQSFGFSRNGTRDLACHKLFKLNTNGKQKQPITMGPSQHCFARQMEQIQSEMITLNRFIRRYS